MKPSKNHPIGQEETPSHLSFPGIPTLTYQHMTDFMSRNWQTNKKQTVDPAVMVLMNGFFGVTDFKNPRVESEGAQSAYGPQFQTDNSSHDLDIIVLDHFRRSEGTRPSGSSKNGSRYGRKRACSQSIGVHPNQVVDPFALGHIRPIQDQRQDPKDTPGPLDAGNGKSAGYTAKIQISESEFESEAKDNVPDSIILPIAEDLLDTTILAQLQSFIGAGSSLSSSPNSNPSIRLSYKHLTLAFMQTIAQINAATIRTVLRPRIQSEEGSAFKVYVPIASTVLARNLERIVGMVRQAKG